MVNLIINENMKVYRRYRTWAMIGFMVAIVILASTVDWYYDNKDASDTSWKAELTEQNAHFEKTIANPEADEDNKEWAQEQYTLNEYRLAHDIAPEAGTMWDGINGAATLVILITLFTVIIAGDSLAGEFSTGTIKLLLIRPANRLKILIAKYVSMLMFGALLLVVLFVSSILVNGILYQFDSAGMPYLTIDSAGIVHEHNMVANLWKTYLLNGVSTIMFVTLAFMISSAFRSSAMAIGFGIFLLFAGAIVMQFLQPYAWAKYMLFANIDLTQYISGQPYQEGMTLGFSIAVLVGYYILFNLVAWLAFTKRDVAA
ncbi:ABC transporter permease [Cohnella sp. GCM10027633]|uniref:ABC transporter permease n=1 Tax=unclassified Cohnella TaxID=2636738 RepID=UPI0036411F5D